MPPICSNFNCPNYDDMADKTPPQWCSPECERQHVRHVPKRPHICTVLGCYHTSTPGYSVCEQHLAQRATSLVDSVPVCCCQNCCWYAPGALLSQFCSDACESHYKGIYKPHLHIFPEQWSVNDTTSYTVYAQDFIGGTLWPWTPEEWMSRRKSSPTTDAPTQSACSICGEPDAILHSGRSGPSMWKCVRCLATWEAASTAEVFGTPSSKLLDLHRTLCDRARQIMVSKNSDYCAGQPDINPYANFDVTESVLGLDGRLLLIARILDKIQRLRGFLHTGQLAVKDEAVDNCLVDIINYSVLFAGMTCRSTNSLSSPHSQKPSEDSKENQESL